MQTMSKVPLLAVLAVLLVALPATASAKMQGWEQDRAKLVADTVWHHPCGDRPVEIVWEPLADADAKVHDDERPPYQLCRVHFNSATDWGWFNLCSYMIHEYGHLANFQDPTNIGDTGHSRDDNSIMSALFVTDDRCDRRGRPYLESRFALSPRSSNSSRPNPGTAGRQLRRTQKSRSRLAPRKLRAASRAYTRVALRSEARALRYALTARR